MATKGGFANLIAQRKKQPDYEVPEGDPLAEPEPASPPPLPVAAVPAAQEPQPEQQPELPPPVRLKRAGKGKKPAKMQVGTYVPTDDFDRLEGLSETTGKTKSRLFTEALALLFKQYRC